MIRPCIFSRKFSSILFVNRDACSRTAGLATFAAILGFLANNDLHVSLAITLETYTLDVAAALSCGAFLWLSDGVIMKLRLPKVPSKTECVKLLATCYRRILPLHWVAWETSAAAMSAIGRAVNEEERDNLIRTWNGMVLYQLSNVELIVRHVYPYRIYLIIGRVPFCQLPSSELSRGPTCLPPPRQHWQ